MMAGEPAVGVPDALARALCEFAALPVADDRVGVLALALNDVVSGRSALASLDLSEAEPCAAFDARWE
jgi:hypothetical protein